MPKIQDRSAPPLVPPHHGPDLGHLSAPLQGPPGAVPLATLPAPSQQALRLKLRASQSHARSPPHPNLAPLGVKQRAKSLLLATWHAACLPASSVVANHLDHCDQLVGGAVVGQGAQSADHGRANLDHGVVLLVCGGQFSAGCLPWRRCPYVVIAFPGPAIPRCVITVWRCAVVGARSFVGPHTCLQ